MIRYGFGYRKFELNYGRDNGRNEGDGHLFGYGTTVIDGLGFGFGTGHAIDNFGYGLGIGLGSDRGNGHGYGLDLGYGEGFSDLGTYNYPRPDDALRPL